MIDDILNPEIKRLKKLSTKKGRLEQGSYLIENNFIVKAAIKYQAPILKIFATKKYINEFSNVTQISDEVALALSDSYSPQEVFAEVQLPFLEEGEIPEIKKGKWIFLDGVQDPGNVGTIIRTANGAGFNGIIVSPRTADVYSPKVLRAMKGAQFKLPIIEGNLVEYTRYFQNQNIPVFGTLVNKDAKDYRKIKSLKNFAFILGNEGQGMDLKLASLTNENFYIPMNNGQESLNVAIAGAIIMYRLSLG
ncbi:MAG: RNA methyltransferase [Lactobacillaceae bacterium]|jgi:TrmH family RNA methyltransferase|nr:RNA methyltransferase [Lactobacillaceae bacterium]